MTSFAVATLAMLGSAPFTGCQSAAQQDLVARELRMQEDQLYAMEDYLEEYQRLVCKYRSENAALKRRLADGGESTSGGARPANGGARPAPSGPTEAAPPTKETAPPLDIDSPDIPPLESTTSEGSRSAAPRRRPRGKVKPVSGDGSEAEPSAARAVALESAAAERPASDVWIHGEVMASEAGGGPRIRVDVEPLDAEGVTTEFRGSLSLMLMSPDDTGTQAPVARWDYRPEDVRAALEAGGENRAIRFYLELPTETAVAEGAELWVRLMQRRGPKLLAHSKIKIEEPGLFSSRSAEGIEGVGSEAGSELAATVGGGEDGADAVGPIADGALPPVAGPACSEIFDGGWTIARPGQPAGLESDRASDKSDWRATLEMPPMVSTQSVPAGPKPRMNRPRESSAARQASSARATKRSNWSPERSSDGLETRTATRPTWSATR